MVVRVVVEVPRYLVVVVEEAQSETVTFWMVVRLLATVH